MDQDGTQGAMAQPNADGCASAWFFKAASVWRRHPVQSRHQRP